MANLVSIARPYALAAFEIAREDVQRLSAWKVFFATASAIATESAMVQLLANPEVLSEKVLELFQSVLGQSLNQQQENFLRLLAENKRLALLPEINTLFLAYCAAFEKISNVQLVTAVTLQDEIKEKFILALKKCVQQEITLICEIDPSILGGAIIRMGDRIIDGSIRGKLTRLLEFLLR